MEKDMTKKSNPNLGRKKRKLNEKLMSKVASAIESDPKIQENSTVDECTLQMMDLQWRMLMTRVCYKWKIENIANMLKKKTFECESEQIVLDEYDLKIKVKLSLKEDDEVYFSYCFIGNSESQFEQKIIPKVTAILKDVRNKPATRDISRTVTCLFSKFFRYNVYYHHVPLVEKFQLTDETYMQNDTIEVWIATENPKMARRRFSSNGLIRMFVPNYSQRVRLAKLRYQNYFVFPYFYTSGSGYRVLVNLMLDGDGDFEGIGITAEIMFVTGKHDLKLEPSFKHKTIIIIKNQQKVEYNIWKCFEFDIQDRCYYLIDLATHEKIENEGYLLDNTLDIEVIIEPI